MNPELLNEQEEVLVKIQQIFSIPEFHKKHLQVQNDV
jgi:hypothetical protein